MYFQRYSPRAVFVSFFIYSFMLGSLFPRLADLQAQMGLGEGALGLALTGLPLGVQISLLVAGRITNLLSFSVVMVAGLFLIGVSFVLAALVSLYGGGPLLFFASLLIAGLSVGLIEVVVNLEADRVEFATGKRIMNRAHAFWSFGFFSTALLGAGASQMQIPIITHMIGQCLMVAVICFVLFLRYQQAPMRRQASPDSNGEQTHETESDADKSPLFVRPTGAILVLVGLTLSAMLAEGAAIDWSVIFMRDIFASPPLIGGMALALAAFFQFATRFFADSLVAQFGARAVARSCLSLLLVGSFCVVFSPHAGVALLGFALLGAGSSVIFPLAMSAAAQLQDRPAAVNVAALAQISFVIFLAAPPLLGLIAELAGLRISFALCLPLVILSFVNLKGLSAEKG